VLLEMVAQAGERAAQSPVADERGRRIAAPAEKACHRRRPVAQAQTVARRAVLMRIERGEQRAERRAGQRLRGPRLREADAGGEKTVEIGRRRPAVAVGRDPVRAQRVDGENDDVRKSLLPGGWWSRPLNPRRRRGQQHEKKDRKGRRKPSAKLRSMSDETQEIRPEPHPGPVSNAEKEASAQSGEPPRWGKGTERAEDGRFLEGPHTRAHEFSRLLRIGADFVRGFRALHFVGPCVTVFGSARFPETHRYYELGREMGQHLGRAGFTVLTGGGPGIMEAANRGARDVKAKSIGLNIILPKEQKPNPYLD